MSKQIKNMKLQYTVFTLLCLSLCTTSISAEERKRVFDDNFEKHMLSRLSELKDKNVIHFFISPKSSLLVKPDFKDLHYNFQKDAAAAKANEKAYSDAIILVPKIENKNDGYHGVLAEFKTDCFHSMIKESIKPIVEKLFTNYFYYASRAKIDVKSGNPAPLPELINYIEREKHHTPSNILYCFPGFQNPQEWADIIDFKSENKFSFVIGRDKNTGEFGYGFFLNRDGVLLILF